MSILSQVGCAVAEEVVGFVVGVEAVGFKNKCTFDAEFLKVADGANFIVSLVEVLV